MASLEHPAEPEQAIGAKALVAGRAEEESAGSLPGALSSFLGRVEELAELTELLGRFRLITLTGAPGVGKTRLARELAGRRSDGAVLVDLAPVSDSALVGRALASALSVAEVPGQTPIETVVAYARRRRLLLVLDNCEHLIGACAQLVEELLVGCPEVSVLATSREALGLPGERVWPVAPLAVPGSGEARSPGGLVAYASVCLFVERAGAVQPGFVLSSYVAPSVGEICRRLDGIPLAIELAAARVDMLTAGEIARRLDDRFGLLNKGSRAVLPRHQTLLGALDWSHELLSGAERALLRRVSVFVGGFCLEAGERVCAGGELESSQVFELLAGLVSKSLVVADTANSRGRYRLLETIRAYGCERLEEAGEAAELRKAHVTVSVAPAPIREHRFPGSTATRPPPAPRNHASVSAQIKLGTVIELVFVAPGTDQNHPPPAHSYLVKQSRHPIRNARDFRRAQTLCGGSCGLTAAKIGDGVSLLVTDLRPYTTYYYAIRARDKVTSRCGPRSKTVTVTTHPVPDPGADVHNDEPPPRLANHHAGPCQEPR